MKAGIIVFPGSNCDDDMMHIFNKVLGIPAVKIWHKSTSLGDIQKDDILVLPGGFSYGDYLRAGAIARFSPVMKKVIDFAEKGGLVFGICNGFQILCEAYLLPGVLLKNKNQKYISKNVHIRVETSSTSLTSQLTKGERLKLPVAHADGRYYCDENTLQKLVEQDGILFRYCAPDGSLDDKANPNGSIEHIAGICNANKNVFGMMPHPERAAEKALGNDQGLKLFKSLLNKTLVTS